VTRTVLLFLALCGCHGPALAQGGPEGWIAPDPSLAEAIDAVVDAPDFEDAFWGVHIVDLTTGETLYARNAQKNFVPASNQKLFSTAAALDGLGPDFRYTTTLYLDGVVRDSVLDGNLVVRGSGDPSIGGRLFEDDYPFDDDPTALFRAWADSLKARGITAVTDHVIGDDDVFDDTELGNGWAWDDVPSVYAAEISGLSFNEGRIRVTAEGTRIGRPAELSWEPDETDYVYFINETETVPYREGRDREVRRERGGNVYWIESEVPPGRRLRHTLSVHNPTRFFAHALRATLRAEGVYVDGDPVDIDDWREKPDYARLVPVASHTSRPLADLVALTNKESQNLYAEHLLKTLGAVKCPPDLPDDVDCGSAEAGLRAAEPLFERAGLDLETMRLRDGSGMTHYNMIAPEDVTALLRTMWAHPDSSVTAAFVNSLAVGGEDGTLSGRLRSGRARGNVRAKTGTVTGAKNLSGYVTTAGGTPLAFSLLTNNFGTSSRVVARAQDAIAQLLARSGR
jgi:D-alanyl-D-alanine carboxypeptidase/D-alanyl-D-alanine-endopeptidase (penicillin-binding protein 4)